MRVTKPMSLYQQPAKPTATSPEAELLLCCSRTQIDSQTRERIGVLLGKQLDWEYLNRVASDSAVLPVFYSALSRLFPSAVPKSSLDSLRNRFRHNVQHNFLLTAELLKLLDALEAHGIKAIPFKGPLLASVAYGDLSLRQFGDLDILVRRSHLEKSRNIILARGYKPWRELTDTQEAAHLHSEHAYTFVREDRNATVDLHWRVTAKYYSFEFDLESLWKRLESVPLAGRRIPSLHHEDLLLYLSIHGAKHCWERLGWICDIAELIRSHPKLDWNTVIARAHALNIERSLLLALKLAEHLLDAPLPESVALKIKNDPEIEKLSVLVLKNLFAEKKLSTEIIGHTSFHVRVRERLQNKLPYLLFGLRMTLTPNEKDFSLVPLPNCLYFCYYPLRIFRLTAAYASRAARSNSHSN
jgi:hypothetical protein